QAKAELYESRQILGRSDNSELRISQGCSRVRELYAIEEIEELRPKVHVEALGNRSLFNDCEIVVRDSACSQYWIGPRFAPESEGRGLSESPGVEPFVEAALRGAVYGDVGTDDVRPRTAAQRISQIARG